MHQITRRSLLAAGGTLLAVAVSGKYLWPAGPGTVDQPQVPAGPEPQTLAALRAQPPAPLPALRFTSADGSVRSLHDYVGQGVVLNFWATWCMPCVSEMPALDTLSRALEGRRIVVLPVSLDRGGAGAVTPFYAGHRIRSLPVLLDAHAETMGVLRLDGIPTTLVIDRTGREVSRVQGPVRWDDAEAPDVLGRLIG